ncbi:TM2 domain-containing protein [Deinococcus murrayi]|uniref:TM2 domain-containing protein n=1 Tax=Deinococcus murrayi TaxID=68910 RepID=UPI0006884F79|nr:TM2 domain-containing protein [Deinococcus murrayi]
MTRNDQGPAQPDDPQGQSTPGQRREVPSWVDEVLSAPPAPSPQRTGASMDPGPDDLRIPEPQRAAPTPPAHDPARPTLLDSADDWIARMTGGAARTPSSEPMAQAPAPRQPDPWALGDSGPVPSDIATRRLIAGLLGIVLGAFGAHKLYLGLTTPGLLMLGVNVGVWVLALLLGLVTLGFGLLVTLPLAGLVTGAVGLLGLVEGILYLTKSDEDFYREYVVGKKPWL